MGFPLLCWHRSRSRWRGWRDAWCFQWEEDQAQSCRCYSCKCSAPPFVSHIASRSTTSKTGTDRSDGAWRPALQAFLPLLRAAPQCSLSPGTDNTQHFAASTSKQTLVGATHRRLCLSRTMALLACGKVKSQESHHKCCGTCSFSSRPSSWSRVSSRETWLSFPNEPFLVPTTAEESLKICCSFPRGNKKASQQIKRTGSFSWFDVIC